VAGWHAGTEREGRRRRRFRPGKEGFMFDKRRREFKGATPSELPVMQATKFEFVINLKTAKALGIQISDNLLSLADAIVE
jgi:hypothetical protein